MVDVFISYSRKNIEFVKQLVSAFEAEGKVVWWDQKKKALEGILVGSPWWEQITTGIEEADNFLFVISPDSIASPYCHAEINHARRHDKRLVTALYCGWISESDTWEAIDQAINGIPATDELPDEVTKGRVNFRSLVRQNWLSINEMQHAIFTASQSFEDPFDLLIKALDLDFAWVKMHSRLRQAVHLWDENGRSDGYLWSNEQLKPVYEFIDRRQADLTDLEREFIRPESDRLVEKLENIDLTHDERNDIGMRLNVIGDTRPGVGLRKDGLPDIAWCKVGDGTPIEVYFRVFYDPITVETPFYIAKYPITYKQFQAFIDAPDGMRVPNKRWWKGLPAKEHDKGTTHSIQRFNFENHPRVSVSWYDTIAFCRWLTWKLKDKDDLPDLKNILEWEVRLPTEAEWQVAAALGDRLRDYPWGPNWDAGRHCNTAESDLSKTTAVGMYPSGAAPCGALDMIGNVVEWTTSRFEILQMSKHEGYIKTIREITQIDIRTTEDRTLRGGTWHHPRDNASVVTRYGFGPNFRHNYIGFRVAYTSPSV